MKWTQSSGVNCAGTAYVASCDDKSGRQIISSGEYKNWEYLWSPDYLAGSLHPYDNLKREKLKQKISQSSKEIIKELIQNIKSLENDEEKLKSAYKVLKAIIKD